MLFQYVNGDGEPQPDHLERRQRLHPRGDRRRLHRQAFPHLGRERDRLRAAAEKAEHARISVKTMVEPVAEALGNTVAMSRKAYVHPALLEAVKDDPRDPLDGMERPRARKWLSSAEVGAAPVPRQGARSAPPTKRRRLIAAAPRQPRRDRHALSIQLRRPGWSQQPRRAAARRSQSRLAHRRSSCWCCAASASAGRARSAMARAGGRSSAGSWPRPASRSWSSPPLDVVATYAELPAAIARIWSTSRFTIAFALQGAIWARELILGADRPPRRRGRRRRRARQRDGDHPRAGQRRPVRDRDHPHPRQSRRERHRAGRRPRHRRHRHRPRRAGHLLRPVRRALDPVRQAVQDAATRSATTRAPGRSSGSA